jgi:hypothetical protein
LGTGYAVIMLPCALVEVLLRFFGDGAVPDYSRTIGIARRDPFRRLKDRLFADLEIDDTTDFHYDLGWSWWFRRGGVPLNLRLSFVGPYATLLSETGDVIVDDPVLDLVRDEGFSVCGEGMLRIPVKIWAPEVEGSLYEFLFEFDNGTPWAR